MTIPVTTIGFTKSTAEHFFTRIRDAGVRTVVDIRLNNSSQLAGFAKADDLGYFLKHLCGAEYQPQPMLAPTDEIMKAFKRDKGDWGSFRDAFLGLMTERQVETRLSPRMLEAACLLCSEDKPHHCHRALVCEYLNGRWGGTLSVRHI